MQPLVALSRMDERLHEVIGVDLPMKNNRVLVCGATGYVGGRLVPRLLDQGMIVRCLVRSPEKMQLFSLARSSWTGNRPRRLGRH